MIWLAAIGGAEPIGYPSVVASPTIAGTTWKLYKGPNTSWTVFSFVAPNEITDFSGDLNDFFKYLIENQGMQSNYYLQTIQAGTEAFTGTGCEFTVSPLTLSMKT